MSLQKPTRPLLRLLRNFLILILIGNFITLFTVPLEMWTLKDLLRNCMFSILLGYPSWIGMGYLINWLEKKLPWLHYPIKRLVAQFLLMTLFAGAVIFAGLAIWFRISEDLSFRNALPFVLPSLKLAYLFMILSLLIANTVLFFKNWKEATLKQEELKRAHLALQYQSLRDQVRPHFLFNSLSSLVTLIQTDTDKATLFVHKLSDVYRYLLEQRDTELVPVEDEIRFLEDYIYLQKIRFGESLRVVIELEPVKKRMIVPLSMQMLVENAIKHNEASMEHPLEIRIHASNEGKVIISNPLQRKETPERSPGLGLENLRKRIAFYTSDELHLEEGAGRFTVTIPTFSFEKGSP
jgi:sensor histidine kinase YesM